MREPFPELSGDPGRFAGVQVDEEAQLAGSGGQLAVRGDAKVDGRRRGPQLGEVQGHVHRVAELERHPVVDLGADDQGRQAGLQELVGPVADVGEKLDASDLQPPDVADIADMAGEVDVEGVDVQVDLDGAVDGVPPQLVMSLVENLAQAAPRKIRM